MPLLVAAILHGVNDGTGRRTLPYQSGSETRYKQGRSIRAGLRQHSHSSMWDNKSPQSSLADEDLWPAVPSASTFACSLPKRNPRIGIRSSVGRNWAKKERINCHDRANMMYRAGIRFHFH